MLQILSGRPLLIEDTSLAITYCPYFGERFCQMEFFELRSVAFVATGMTE